MSLLDIITFVFRAKERCWRRVFVIFSFLFDWLFLDFLFLLLLLLLLYFFFQLLFLRFLWFLLLLDLFCGFIRVTWSLNWIVLEGRIFSFPLFLCLFIVVEETSLRNIIIVSISSQCQIRGTGCGWLPLIFYILNVDSERLITLDKLRVIQARSSSLLLLLLLDIFSDIAHILLLLYVLLVNGIVDCRLVH